jgi:hypothetical protein
VFLTGQLFIMKKYITTPTYIVLISILSLFQLAKGNSQDFDWENALKVRLQAMADSLTANLKPWEVPDTVFYVEDYGAVADGTTLNTLAIQTAIDSCSSAGGGIVRFSSGDYVTGTIQIKSGVMIEVSENARILGSLDLDDYPEMIEEFKSVMSENHKFRQSLIYAEKAGKIGIRGKGEIYFRGEKANFPGKQTIGEIIGRPFGIRMIQCNQVVLQDIFLHNSAAWMQSYILCNDMIFDGIKVENHANYNNDGLDPDGCTNVIIRNCFINSEDDAMCLKSASNRVTKNVLIENSTFVSTCNALKIGTDTQGPFRNILARNLILGGIPDSLGSSAGRQSSTGITLATVDGGNVEDIYIHDITINRARCPVFIRIGNRLRVMPGLPKPPVGHLKRVVIEDVEGKGNYRQGSFISGIKGDQVDGVIIRNYKVEMEGGGSIIMAQTPVTENEGGYPDAHQFSVSGLPAYGFYIRHAQNIWLDTVEISPVAVDKRPEFVSGGNVGNVIINGKGIEEQEVYVYQQKYFDDVRVLAPSPKFKIDSIRPGAMVYTDRDFKFPSLHDVMKGAEFLCWQNNLKNYYANVLVKFSLKHDGTLYIAHDKRLAKPKWLLDGFQKTDTLLLFANETFELFYRKVEKNMQIELGENQVKGTETGTSTNYLVFFVPEQKPVVSIKKPAHQGFELYPNPSNGQFRIRFAEEQQREISILDMTGKQLYSKEYHGDLLDVNAGFLKNGLYIVCANTLNNPARQPILIHQYK